MEKFVNYIKNGKGIGVLFLMAAAVLMTLIMMIMFKDVYSALRPQATLIAEDILPLTIQNHRIVNPANTYKKFNLTLGDTKDKFSFPIILDTRSQMPEMPKSKEGLYIMTDAVYMIAPTQIRRFEFQNDGVIDKAAFETLADYITNSIFIVVSIIFIAVYFLSGLFKAWLAALIASFGQKFILGEKRFNMGTLMRLSSVATAGIELLFFVLFQSSERGLSFIQFILLILLAEAVFLYKQKSPEN